MCKLPRCTCKSTPRRISRRDAPRPSDRRAPSTLMPNTGWPLVVFVAAAGAAGAAAAAAAAAAAVVSDDDGCARSSC
jgi:hypothetical protein